MHNFISSYLTHFRTKDADPPNDIFPFTKDAVNEIHKAAEGNIRRMLMICNQALDMAVDMGFPKIGAEKLKEMLPDLFEISALSTKT